MVNSVWQQLRPLTSFIPPLAPTRGYIQIGSGDPFHLFIFLSFSHLPIHSAVISHHSTPSPPWSTLSSIKPSRVQLVSAAAPCYILFVPLNSSHILPITGWIPLCSITALSIPLHHRGLSTFFRRPDPTCNVQAAKAIILVVVLVAWNRLNRGEARLSQTDGLWQARSRGRRGRGWWWRRRREGGNWGGEEDVWEDRKSVGSWWTECWLELWSFNGWTKLSSRKEDRLWELWRAAPRKEPVHQWIRGDQTGETTSPVEIIVPVLKTLLYWNGCQ